MNAFLKQLLKIYKKARSSIWTFPLVLTLILVGLVALQINGSSIGLYHKVFYGDTPDKNLILNQPQSIRSDEYSMNTQMTIAQHSNDYAEMNNNLGDGMDMSLLADAPYKDWSAVFRPHNLGFFIMPFDSAFALKWWMPAYLLILSSYFFILLMLPKRKILASLLSLAFFYSPFFQWWYMPGVLSTVAYCLFGVLILIKIFQSKIRLHMILWSVLLFYIGVSFALIIYPPFQIPCVIVALSFLVGYFLQNRYQYKLSREKIIVLSVTVLATVSVVGIFLYQRRDAVEAIENTVYPGQRVVKSGGFNAERVLSSQLGTVLQEGYRYEALEGKAKNSVNQSELSSFMIIMPVLLLPSLFLLYRNHLRKKKIDYIAVSLLVTFLLFISWLFIPGLDIIGKITFLEKVPTQRLVIGLGFLNFVFFIQFIKLAITSKSKFSLNSKIIYCLLIVMAYLVFNLHMVLVYPGFIGFKSAVLLALPFALITFCLLDRRFKTAALILLCFTFASSYHVNPLYKGTDTLTNSTLSQSIHELHSKAPDKVWVGDDNYFENFALMNGAHSLSGTYLYPHLNLWSKIDKKQQYNSVYNRYAHVNFAFDRNKDKTIETTFYRPNTDLFYIIIEPCDTNFLKKENVGFLLTTQALTKENAPCATFQKKIDYYKTDVYLYKLSF